MARMISGAGFLSVVRGRGHVRRALLATSILAGGVAGSAHAVTAPPAGGLPTGGTTAAGSATITNGPNSVTVNQTSARAVINWQSFSVDQGSTITFAQPDVASATLNRVTGATASTIAGNITSNGAVYLVNPNGIAITGTGAVNTAGGFVASTLDIADSDFMAGKLNFLGKGSSASVSNRGNINAGQNAFVALLGGQVDQAGYVTVPYGKVGLGSGEQITLDINGNNFMAVAVQTGSLGGTAALVANRGFIQASGGTVLLSAATLKSLVRNVINMSGTINADNAIGDGGTIRLLGGAGGTVAVTGNLLNRSIGASGNGGTVETSGGQLAVSSAGVYTWATNGKTGNWIIDPADFTIAAGGGDITGAGISTNLSRTNITILLSGGSTGVNGDINVNDAISWSSGKTLNLSAFRDVNLNAAITGSGPGAALVLRADNSGTGTGTVLFGAGGGVNLSGAGSTVKIYYNPASFGTATNFAPNVSAGTVTAYQLVNNLANLFGINANLAGTYAMARNIDANGVTNPTPIGVGAGGNLIGNGFTGIFDGQGYTIANLTMNRATPYAGLFGASYGTITNINLAVANITGTNFVGTLVGYNAGRISNSTTTGSVTGNGSSRYVGGLAGYNAGTISASASSAGVAGLYYAGGLVGLNDHGTISQSLATGTVSGVGMYYVGGLVGYNYFGTISQAAASGAVSVTGASGDIGGLVGLNTSGAVSNSYATGAVTAPGGGSVGGLIGYNNGSSVTSTYATGHVSGAVDGLIGTNSGTVTSSYYDTQTTGQTGSAGGAGLTTAQLQNFATYTATYSGWNFAAIWSPPSQAGQAGQTSGYYPQLYALTPVVVATPTNASRTYGAANPALGMLTSGGPNRYVFGPPGDSLPINSLFVTSAGATTNVGTYAIAGAPGSMVTSAGGVTYREIVPTNATLTINPATVAVTYTAFAATRVYGDASPKLNGSYAATGFVNGDSLFNVGTATPSFTTSATPASNVGAYAISGSGITSTGPNYVFTAVQAPGNATALTITPRPLSLTPDAASRYYGYPNPTADTATGNAPTNTSGLANGDTVGSVAVTSPATATSPVGQYALDASSASFSHGLASNYSISYVTNPTGLTVSPEPVTVTYVANPITRLYGAANPAITGTVTQSGLVNGDTLSGVTNGTATFVTNVTPSTNVGQYAIVGTGLSGNNANYAFSFVQAPGNATAFTINPAPLTVTYYAVKVYKTYGNANPPLSGQYTATGFVNGENTNALFGNAVFTTAANALTGVGSYAVNGSGISSSNYAITNVQDPANATALQISPRLLTLTPDSLTRVYGSAIPSTDTVTASPTDANTGLVNGDSVASSPVTTNATVNSPVATYNLATNNAVFAHGTAANYTITYANNPNGLAVTPAPLTLTYTANPVTRLYGSENPTFTGNVSASGLVAGDTIQTATVSGYAFNSPATSGSGVGSYAITGAGLMSNGNYTLTSLQASSNATALTITPAPLTIIYTATQAYKTYGTANPPLTGVLSSNGLVNHDTISGVTNGAAMFTSPATAQSGIGSYAVNGSGLTAGTNNYTFSFVQASANATALLISPRLLTLTADPLSRPVNTPNPTTDTATGNTPDATTGLVNGDKVGSVAVSTDATPSSPAGQYALTGSNAQFSQGSIANYTISYATNQKALTVTPMAGPDNR